MGSRGTHQRKPDRREPVYEVRIEGQLDALWAAWFEGFCLTNLPDDQIVVLRGPVADQSALHGLLNRIRDLNLTLVSVERIDGGK